MIHQLKTEPEYFESVINGSKPFEVRENDRNFAVGDFLALNEFSLDGCIETGRCCLVEITYVLTDPRFLKVGYVVLGIRPCAINKQYDDMRYPADFRKKLYEVIVYDRS